MNTFKSRQNVSQTKTGGSHVCHVTDGFSFRWKAILFADDQNRP